MQPWVYNKQRQISITTVYNYRRGLPMSSVDPGPVTQGSNMRQPGLPGVAGVVHGRLICFKLL